MKKWELQMEKDGYESLLKEAREISENHPSKDARSFAGDVFRFLSHEYKIDLFDEGWKYITCYVTNFGKLCPMGDAKDKESATEIAKKHKHVLCRLVKLGDFREDKE